MNPRPGARWRCRLALGALLLAAPGNPVRAEEPPADYAPDSEAWNGLGTLVGLARGLGLEVASGTSLDWKDLAADDLVVMLYPTRRIEAAHLAAFLRHGGRLLLGDDFGSSNEPLARLGMLRGDAVGVGAHRFHDELSYAPVARPLRPEHPLARGVNELYCNHPAILGDTGGAEAIFGFAEHEALVVAGSLGEGRFVVLSDPSLLINQMLAFPGNLQFAVNALRFLDDRGRARRLVLLTGDFSLLGEPRGLGDDGTVSGALTRLLRSANDALYEFNDYLLTEGGMRALALVAALVVAVLLVRVLPLRQASALDGEWTRVQASGAAGGGDLLAACAQGTGLPPAPLFALLVDQLKRRLRSALPAEIGALPAGDRRVAEAVRARCGPGAASNLRTVLGQLDDLHRRAAAAAPPVPPGELERLVRNTERLCQQLESGSQSAPQ
jgi:hypothetical protein